LVFDGGTLEHVFDVANALRTVCRFTKPGGRVVHLSPLSNCVDHGFYSFSPIFFTDFYAANNWIIRRLAIARFERDPATDPWEIRDYRPDDFLRLGALPEGTYFLLTCVESKSDSTYEVVPQQSYYTKVWGE
jgi:SAM-dependent methyltransferase